MTPELTAIVVLITGLVTAIAAIVSALAAWKSSSHAKSLSDEASNTEKRMLIREIAKSCREAIDLGNGAKDLAEELLLEIRDLAIFTGQSGGSRRKVIENEIQKDQDNILLSIDAINDLFTDNANLDSISTEQLNQIHAKIIIQQTTIYSAQQRLNRKLLSINEQIRPFREKSIKGG